MLKLIVVVACSLVHLYKCIMYFKMLKLFVVVLVGIMSVQPSKKCTVHRPRSLLRYRNHLYTRNTLFDVCSFVHPEWID